MTTFLTRAVRFSAAHRYHRPEWSEERNRQVFGACANPHGHGHNYLAEVTYAGTPDPETGFCLDLGELDRLLDERVRRPLDHQHINHAIPEFAEGAAIPTTENLAIWIWRRLEGALPAARLVRVRLQEEEGLFVEYRGDRD
jgi:6-pyruvoyltetrahydropterin/6-carboxytetrahydropterin synthase